MKKYLLVCVVLVREFFVCCCGFHHSFAGKSAFCWRGTTERSRVHPSSPSTFGTQKDGYPLSSVAATAAANGSKNNTHTNERESATTAAEYDGGNKNKVYAEQGYFFAEESVAPEKTEVTAELTGIIAEIKLVLAKDFERKGNFVKNAKNEGWERSTQLDTRLLRKAEELPLETESSKELKLDVFAEEARLARESESKLRGEAKLKDSVQTRIAEARQTQLAEKSRQAEQRARSEEAAIDAKLQEERVVEKTPDEEKGTEVNVSPFVAIKFKEAVRVMEVADLMEEGGLYEAINIGTNKETISEPVKEKAKNDAKPVRVKDTLVTESSEAIEASILDASARSEEARLAHDAKKAKEAKFAEMARKAREAKLAKEAEEAKSKADPTSSNRLFREWTD